jgi:hypothetical protein
MFLETNRPEAGVGTHRELAMDEIWTRCIEALCQGETHEAARLYKFYTSVTEMTDNEFDFKYQES